MCPACLGQQAAWTPTLELVGVLLVLPFAVVALVIRAIRRAQRELD
jgi:hypothetical protein